MIEAIISGISNALFDEFGHENYAGRMPQGLSPPCFFIRCMESGSKRYIGTRRLQRNHFLVQYFPLSENEADEECQRVGERMVECLEVINADGFLLRGMEMSFKVMDGVLHFFADYNAFVRKDGQKAVMEGVQGCVHLKG